MKKRNVTAMAIVGLLFAVAATYLLHRMPASSQRSAAGQAAAAPTAGAGSGNGSGAAVPVEVIALHPRVLQEDLQAVGSLRSNESVVLRPEVAGRIAQIAFGDGERVRRGQLLVALDASLNEAEVAQARAEYEFAQSNLRRTEDLARRNFVSSSAQEQAASTAEVQLAKLKLAQTRLEKMRILAPFDGVVGIRAVSVGDYVKDGADLINVEDISTLKVDFRLPERFFAQLKVGQPVEITADALPDERFVGRLDAINPRIDANGRSLELRGSLANRGARLRPGMFARVRVIVGERPQALLVPEQAIVPSGNEFFVYRAVDGRAQRVQVQTGLRRDGLVEVVDGLAAGDRVVVAGQLRLTRDGQPVQVQARGDAPPPAAAGDGGPR